MPSTFTANALFTQNGGAPATGLSLSDIDMYLYSTTLSGGTIAAIWNTENPTAEIPNTGMYIRQYSLADLDLYTYSFRATYTGSTILDNYNVYAVHGRAEVDAVTVAASVSSQITFVSPLSSDGDLATIVKGDDYQAADGRELTWASSGWTDLTGATIAFNWWNPKNRGDRGSFTGNLNSVGGATQVVALEMTAAQTKTFKTLGKRVYRYEVSATLGGNEITLVSSDTSYITVVDSFV